MTERYPRGQAAVKLWLLGTLIVGVLIPVHTGRLWVDTGTAPAAMVALAVATGLVESSMGRLRLVHVPQLLAGAGVLAMLALVLVLRGTP